MLTRHEILLFIASTVVLFVALMYSPWGTLPLFDSKGEVRDFAFYLATISGFIDHRTTGMANPQAILDSLRLVLGIIAPEGAKPGPNGLSPTALIIWFPLLFPLQFSINAAFCAWLATSLSLVLLNSARLWRESVPNNIFARSTMLALTIAVLTSAVTRTCLDIGQTSLFAAGLLGILARELRTQSNHSSWSSWLGLILFLLSLKSHYFIIGLGMLAIERRWRSILLGCGLITVAVLTMDPYGDQRLVPDFFRTMEHFSGFDEAGNNGFYRGEFASSTPTWLTVTEGVLPDCLRHFVNTAAVIIGALGLVILFIRSKAIPTTKRLTAASAIMTGVYLCFSPYLGFYEQLLLIVPLIAGAEPELFYFRRGTLVMLVGVMLSLSSLPLKGVVWASKVAVVSGMLTISRANR